MVALEAAVAAVLATEDALLATEDAEEATDDAEVTGAAVDEEAAVVAAVVAEAMAPDPVDMRTARVASAGAEETQVPAVGLWKS